MSEANGPERPRAGGVSEANGPRCASSGSCRHPAERVWRALTDPAEHERWTGWRSEIEPTAGGRMVTYHGPGEEKEEVVDEVTRFEPPHVFQHTFWKDTNPSSVVTWEVTPLDASSCRLVLTHEFAPGSVPDEERNSAGWNRLVQLLADALEPPS